MSERVGAPFAEVLSTLESIAPLALAETWDNVGLLVPPSSRESTVLRALFTIDLTEPVLAEAVDASVDLVVAYHPVIFKGLTRLDDRVPPHRVILAAIRAGLAVYSPHTSLDAAPDGMNDWLAEALGGGATRPITPSRQPFDGAGMGRVVELGAARSLAEIVQALKAHLGLAHVRLAAAPSHAEGEPIRSAAVCVGAGGGLFESVGDVDLLVTGEMRHHDVLARVARGTSVVLTEHSNSERGYLARYASRVSAALEGRVACLVSAIDRDPLTTV